MNITELKELAEKATPIFTELYGDRYFSGDYSRCDLTKEQDDFIAAANPAAILELIAKLEDAQGEIRALRATEAGLVERVKELEEGLRALYKGCVNLLQAGKDRIESLGGTCDAVDRMESDSPFLRAARALLEKKE